MKAVLLLTLFLSLPSALGAATPKPHDVPMVKSATFAAPAEPRKRKPVPRPAPAETRHYAGLTQ